MAVPDEQGGVLLAEREDVVAAYLTWLCRAPENEGAIQGRVGMPLWLVRTEISNSQEAQNVRAAGGCGAGQPVGPVGPAGAPIGPVGPSTGAPEPGRQSSPIPGVDFIIDQILTPIGGSLRQIGDKLNEISGGKLGELAKQLQAVGDAVSKGAGRITADLTSALVNVANGALAITDAALKKSNEILGGFIENAADVFDVAGAFVDTVGKEKDKIVKAGLDIIGEGVAGALFGFLENLEKEAPEVATATSRRLLESPLLPDHVREILAPMLSRTRPANFIMGIIFGALSIGSFANATLAQEIELTRQAAAEQFPVSIPSAPEIAQAEVRGIINNGDAEALAKRWGYDQVPYRIMREVARNYPPYQEAIGGWLRGALDDAGLDHYLARNGYDETARGLFKELAFIVPPAQDAIRFAVREVYDDKRRAELTLDADLPPRFLVEARKSGIAEPLARDYWAAHWELPSPEQVYEMLHRRARKPNGDVFTQADVDAYLQAADFAPVWRPLLSQIAFNPLTRVDVRRMRKLDILSRAEVESAYVDLGYDATNARRLADFVERDVKGEKKVELADLTAGLRSRIVAAVVNGTISEDRGKHWLAELGADPDDVTVLIAEARELRAGSRADRVRELVEQLYVKGRWTLDEARAELRRRGFVDEEVAAIADEIQLERKLRAPEERELADRDLTKAEILDARDDALIDDNKARAMLAELRYDQAEIELMVALRDYKRAQKEQAAEIETIHRRFVAGKMTEEAASGELDRLVLPAGQRNRLILKWDAELRAKSSDLPYSTVGELVKRHLMPEDEAGAYLVRLGFDERETTLSLALWGAQGAEQAARAQTAADKRAAAEKKAAEDKARRLTEAAAKAAAKQRDLSTGQLVAAFKKGVLNEAQLRAELIALRYSQAEATVIIETAKAAAPRRV